MNANRRTKKSANNAPKVRVLPSGLFRIDVSLGVKPNGKRDRRTVLGTTADEVIQNARDLQLAHGLNPQAAMRTPEFHVHILNTEELAAAVSIAVVKTLEALGLSIPTDQKHIEAEVIKEAATISPLEFSRGTGYGLNRVRDLLNAGKIKHVRSGRRILIFRSEVQAFLDRESQGGDYV